MLGSLKRSAILTYVFEKLVSRRERRFTFTTRIFNRSVNKVDILDIIVIIIAILLNAFIFVRSKIKFQVITFQRLIFYYIVLVRSYRFLIIIVKIFRDLRSLVYPLGRYLEAISGISLITVIRSLLLTIRRTVLIYLLVSIIKGRSKRGIGSLEILSLYRKA